ncbi:MULTISPECIES: hypothetical protein [Bacillus cereus group]|uniref:hypothetical protein n=1 Tax=Bacillus cereus group TaxID=86661 RepID=UPI0010141486|nr:MULTISPECIES: hypothetical protein [Bacillus cereus group]MCU5201661.1 hypothetical protein [Bacillus paranthracis]MCU5374689.1 hypothetical protein [Bacillus pacificus]GCF76367.1 hypothetical protein BC2926_39080 [Bacillus cereus]
MGEKTSFGQVYVKPTFFIIFGATRWAIESSVTGEQVANMLRSLRMLCRATGQTIPIEQEEIEKVISKYGNNLSRFEKFLKKKNNELYLVSQKISSGSFLRNDYLTFDTYEETIDGYDIYFNLEVINGARICVKYDKKTKRCKEFSFAESDSFDKKDLKFYNIQYPIGRMTNPKMLSDLLEKIKTIPDLRFKLLFL